MSMPGRRANDLGERRRRCGGHNQDVPSHRHLIQTRAMELSTCGRFLAQESNEHTVVAVSEEEG